MKPTNTKKNRTWGTEKTLIQKYRNHLTLMLKAKLYSNKNYSKMYKFCDKSPQTNLFPDNSYEFNNICYNLPYIIKLSEFPFIVRFIIRSARFVFFNRANGTRHF